MALTKKSSIGTGKDTRPFLANHATSRQDTDATAIASGEPLMRSLIGAGNSVVSPPIHQSDVCVSSRIIRRGASPATQLLVRRRRQ